jgi:Metallo-peptidase family M12B Reprolysin-like
MCSSRRSAARLLAALAVCSGVLLPAASASADEPAATTVVGELVQAYPEQAQPEHDGAADAPLSWIRTAGGRAVRVDTADLADVPAGSTVSVDVGGSVHDEASADGYDPAQAVLATDVLEPPAAAELPAAGVTDEVTVVQVTPTGVAPDAVGLEQLVDAVDGPVARFWSEQSDGAIRLHVTATRGWLQLPVDCTDPNGLWNRAAAAAGFHPGPGRHLVVYLNPAANLPGCSYALGTVGSGPASGGSLYVRDALPSVIAHELGHNFGLGHSSGVQCDAGVEAGTCRTEGYRDYYDVMGASWSQVGALTAAQADRLGLLPASAQLDLPAGAPTGTYRLTPLAGGTGTRAIRLTAADGTVYWLEYRAATGQDAWLSTPANRFRLQTGVLLHRAGALPDTSLLLDGTPSPAGRQDADLQAALPTGAATTVDDGAFTVTVGEVTSSAATVTVAAAPAPAGAPSSDPTPEPTGGVLAARPATGAAPATARPTHPAPQRQAVATAPATPAASGPAATGTAQDSAGQDGGTAQDGAVAAAAAAPALAPAAASGSVPRLAGVGALALGGALLLGVLAGRLRRRSRRG